jgi:hypothetical protein
MLRRASRGRRVTKERVALDRFAGAATTNFAASEEANSNHVYVEGRSHAVVVLPLTSVFTKGEKSTRVRSRSDLMKASEGDRDPIPLAVLHTDVELTGVHARNRGGRREGSRRPGPPGTKRGTCAPGTYVIALWWGRPCLCLESLEFACFLTETEAKRATIDVERVEEEALAPSRISPEPEADLVFVSFSVPVGGPRTDPRLTAVVKTLALNTRPGALKAAGAWKTHAE